MSMLLDSMLASALLAASIVQLDMQHLRTAERNVAISTGQYLNGLQAGLNKYIAVNGDTLAGRSPGPYVDPNNNPIALANPLAPTVAELQRFGFLPPGYTTNNPSRLTFTIAIERSGCPGTGCTLPATIRTSQYRDLQGNVRNDLAAFVMQAAGLDGGQALPSNPGMFTGVGGSWQLPNASNAVGSIAMRAGSLTTGYVDTLPFYKLDGSRKLTGTMQADGHNIAGAGNISSASLNTTGNGAIGGTMSAANAWVGGTTTTNELGANNANVWGTTSTGQLNTNNANVWGTTSTGQLNASNSNVTGTATANQVNANNANVWGNQQVFGTQTVSGALVAGNAVYLTPIAMEGWGCGAPAITSQPDGTPLACTNGFWQKMGGDALPGTACGIQWNESAPVMPCGGLRWTGGPMPCPSGYVRTNTIIEGGNRQWQCMKT